jgi:hypothetical protein
MCLAWDAAVMLMGEISRFGSVKVDVVECPDRMSRANEIAGDNVDGRKRWGLRRAIFSASVEAHGRDCQHFWIAPSPLATS